MMGGMHSILITIPLASVAFLMSAVAASGQGADAPTRRPDRTIASPFKEKEQGGSLSISSDGKLAASNSGAEVVIWDTSTWKVVRALRSSSRRVTKMAFSPDGTILGTGGNDGLIDFWNAQTGELRGTIEAHEKMVSDLVFTPDGRSLISGSLDRTVRVWGPATGKPRDAFPAQTGMIASMAVSNDGKTLAIGDYDAVITILDVGERRVISQLKGHRGAVAALVFSPDGRSLISGSLDRTVRVWDPATGAARMTIGNGPGFVYTVALAASSSGSRRIIAGGADRVLRVWDEQRKPIWKSVELPGKIVQCVVARDGRTFLVSTDDLSVSLFHND